MPGTAARERIFLQVDWLEGKACMLTAGARAGLPAKCRTRHIVQLHLCECGWDELLLPFISVFPTF
jgi:hypothetical protein